MLELSDPGRGLLELNYVLRFRLKFTHINKLPDYLTNESKKAEVKKLEIQIDQMVYNLYGLTDEEIKIVENSNKKNNGQDAQN